ncbi:MAG: hypothetical protein ABL962_12500 [Fimbriimonadaceae bacterium]
MSRRGTSQNANSGYGCLGLGVIGVVAFFALLGVIAPRSSGKYSSSSADYSPQETQQISVPVSASELSPLAKDPTSTQLKPSDPPAVPAKAETLSVQPAEFDLASVEAVKIFAKLGLATKGFDFKRNAESSQLFWTLRKTDTDREYTAVFLAGDNGKTKAITLELVSVGAGIDEFARNYFKTVVGAFMPPADAKEVESWIMKLASSTESKSFAGLQFSWNSTITTHRRLTIQ